MKMVPILFLVFVNAAGCAVARVGNGTPAQGDARSEHKETSAMTKPTAQTAELTILRICLKIEQAWSSSSLTIDEDGSASYEAHAFGSVYYQGKKIPKNGTVTESGSLSHSQMSQLRDVIVRNSFPSLQTDPRRVLDGTHFTLTIETKGADGARADHAVSGPKDYVAKDFRAIVDAVCNAWKALGKEFIVDPGT